MSILFGIPTIRCESGCPHCRRRRFRLAFEILFGVLLLILVAIWASVPN